MIYEDGDVDEEQLQQMNIQVPEVVLELPSDSDSSRCGNSCYGPLIFWGPLVRVGEKSSMPKHEGRVGG